MKLSPRTPLSPAPRAGGFTLIEMIGVLAIVAILATIIATSVMGRLRRAAREAESISMTSLADGIRTHIRTMREIPSVDRWPACLARELGIAPDRVQKTSAGYTRQFIADPDLRVQSGADQLPYVQGIGSSAEPTKARIMILSSLGAPLPAVSMTAAKFQTIWDTTDGSIPSPLSTYAGAAEDLRIQRVDLRDLFCRVILSNFDNANDASFSLNGVGGTGMAAVGPFYNRWVIIGTPLDLLFANRSLQARDLVRSDLSYVFEHGQWTRYLAYGRQAEETAVFATAVTNFLATAASSTGGAITPASVVQEMYLYLSTYATWSSGSGGLTAFVTGTSNAPAPVLRTLQDSQQRLDDFTTALITPAQ